jgi:hypothetical protein
MYNVLEVFETEVCRMMSVLQMVIKGQFDCSCMDCFVMWVLPTLMSGSLIVSSLLADTMKWSFFVASN